jgi:hypothetical protein
MRVASITQTAMRATDFSFDVVAVEPTATRLKERAAQHETTRLFKLRGSKVIFPPALTALPHSKPGMRHSTGTHSDSFKPPCCRRMFSHLPILF